VSAPFPRRSPPRLLTDAARGGLGPPLQGGSVGPTYISDAAGFERVRSSTPIPPSAFVAHHFGNSVRYAACARARPHSWVGPVFKDRVTSRKVAGWWRMSSS